MGDGVTDRTRTGFLRGHNPACRPLPLRSQSTREESNPRLPPREGGGLPLTYSSLPVGRRGVEPRRPASAGGACSGTERSKVRALAGSHVTGEGTLVLRIEQAEPAAGVEPAAPRVRAECPAVRTSPAESGRRESNPHHE